MEKPKIIQEQEEKLLALINKDKNPDLSVSDVADFMRMDRECLREACARGTCPFGLGGQRPGGNRFVKIPKLTFYNWYTKGIS